MDFLQDIDKTLNFYVQLISVPTIISCAWCPLIDRVCGAHLAYSDSSICVTINGRFYYVVEPARCVNIVIGPVAFVPHFYEHDLVHAVRCRSCTGWIGYSKFNLLYLCNVHESHAAEVMFVDGYDDSESESESGSSDEEENIGDDFSGSDVEEEENDGGSTSDDTGYAISEGGAVEAIGFVGYSPNIDDSDYDSSF